MRLNIAIQMDPIEGIDITGDSTFALGLEAQSRGHELFLYSPVDLSMQLKPGDADQGSSELMAHGRPVSLRDEAGNHFTAGDIETRSMQSFDAVLMRQDPPFDMQYITATHLLEHIHPQTLVVNDPAEVRNAPEKLLVTHFPELMPPTLISRNADDIKAFRAEYGEIIVKPLFGNGGAGVFHLKPDDSNLSSLLEVMLEMDRAPLMAQQ